MSTYNFLVCHRCLVCVRIGQGDGVAEIYRDAPVPAKIRQFLLDHRNHEIRFVDEHEASIFDGEWTIQEGAEEWLLAEKAKRPNGGSDD